MLPPQRGKVVRRNIAVRVEHSRLASIHMAPQRMAAAPPHLVAEADTVAMPAERVDCSPCMLVTRTRYEIGLSRRLHPPPSKK